MQDLLNCSTVTLSPVSVTTPPWQRASPTPPPCALVLPMSSEGSEYWISSLGLYEKDRDCISKGNWLNDNVISVSLCLLKEEHPGIGGLQPTVLGANLSFDVQKGAFVQVYLDLQ